ncbi:hypothetical protein PHYSODRAFT_297819 [Phytophthora sojae]|uniref:Uncharacterized protein n=1 Tax=Phytophthora sojae (strain P6497) TaxID=1094619 RepID=G4Z9Q4_PHYSP|nr:hypothetical protein PHYSODRAFT_297819 [Phytophthora sojae]EGZ19168.1 hypothetical protein PHYSODRAFT_297819 [Phytophthora sojae]|eukprot:XP_009521885.1 hypothetical protein PHYSODRAFT_297819 [Phytophthora sojae]
MSMTLVDRPAVLWAECSLRRAGYTGQRHQRDSPDFSGAGQLDLATNLELASLTPVQSPSSSPVKDTPIGLTVASGRNTCSLHRSFRVHTKRKTRKEQMNDLRELVAMLTQQIQELKSSPSPASSTITSVSRQSPWQCVASRQKMLRLKSENDNAALLQIKSLQLREIKNFKRMFRRRIDEERTANSNWRCLGHRKVPEADHVYAEDYYQSEDTATSYIHFVCSLGGTVAYIHEHGAARKFVEENRTVIVSQMTSRPAGKKIGFFGGLKYREEMSVVVRSGARLASGQETAIIETYLAVFQSDEGSEAAKAFRAPGIMELAIKGWDSKVALRKHEIENLLFDDALAHQGTTIVSK